ncbi:cell division protein FtsK [Nonlabens ulvanivorans]|uniref:Cell division protein FtsK n=1 Tax=Nonlabens ulvanivorans TaxID=906888 RepID=A0A090Q9H7_NONUL|nr:cell division protein FtsK [Nonlabens ulvanivorans]
MGLGVILLFSFISFFFTWREDQSILGNISDREIVAQNWLSKIGAGLSDFFIYDGFGIAALSIPVLIIITGIFLFAAKKDVFTLSRKRILNLWFWGIIINVMAVHDYGLFSCL